MAARYCSECEVNYPAEDEFKRCPACDTYCNLKDDAPHSDWQWHLAETAGRPWTLSPLTQKEVAQDENGEWYIHRRVLKMHGYPEESGTIVRVLSRTEKGPDIFVEVMGKAGKLRGIELPGVWVKRIDPAAEFADLPVLAGGD